jgi:ribulose-5-phosphate 4-epimerase/fuculose-1-phosphate aldolase
MSDTELTNDLADAHAALAAAGLTDMVWGHVSARDPGGRGVWMKAAGWGFEEITPDHVLLVSPSGDVLAGEGRRHIEYPIHTRIMAARADAGAVVHSHGEAAATFASLEVPLRALNHAAAPFLEQADIPRYTATGNLISDDELGDGLADALGDAAGVLIPGHGFVVVGPTIPIAVMRAVLLETACRVHLGALAAGGPARWSDDAELASKRDTVWNADQYQAGYDYLVRQAR